MKGKLINKKKKQIISMALVGALVAGTFAIPNYIKGDKSPYMVSANKVREYDVVGMKRDTNIAVDTTGDINIERRSVGNTSMGEDDTWTILIYMDGSDLELCYGNASKDLKEIMSAKICSSTIKNVNIIVQTGGSSMWQLHDIDGSKTQRLKIESIGGPTIIEEMEPQNMGDADTLSDFLKWGVENYPAENMGVIFWNHGSGVSGGVCMDKQDALMVPELEYAFSKASKDMTDKFEFIGFDTCLSGSLEYAHALAPYANYMVASANTEPGEGWSYQEFMDTILLEPSSTTTEVGKIICDTYYQKMNKAHKDSRLTMALYNLSKVDDVCVETNRMAKFMYESAMEDNKFLDNITGLHISKRLVIYGSDYENIDVGSMASYLNSKYDYDTSALQSALNDFIVHSQVSDIYKKNGGVGLSWYCPNDRLSAAEFAILRNATFSPYQMKYLEYMAHFSRANDMDKFEEYPWENSKYFYEDNFEFLDYYGSANMSSKEVEELLSKNSEYVEDGFINRWVSNYPREFSSNVNLDEGRCVVERSYGCDRTCDTECSEHTKFILSDGQELTTYVEESLGEVIYAIPVVIDDIEMMVRFKEVEEKGTKTYKFLGVWDATYNSEYEGRGYLPLEKGSVITPIYDVYDEESGEYDSEYGQEYIVESYEEFLIEG